MMRRLPWWVMVGWLLVALVLPMESPWAKKEKETISLFADPEAFELMDDMASPILKAAGIPADLVHFHIMVENTLNAFALPNNHIVFHSRLVLAVRDRDELAAVMAHEIAHLAAGHHQQIQDSARHISIRSLVTAAVGLAAGMATGNAEIGQASMMGGMASGTASLLEMVREKETQADRLAIHYLSQAGYEPKGLTAFMERITKEQRLSPLPPPYLLTHPMGSQRLDEARDMAQRAEPAQRRAMARDAASLARIQAKLEAATSEDPLEMARDFRDRLKKHPNDVPARYGLALADRYSGNLDSADTLLTQLLKDTNAHDPFVLRERALVRLEKGDLKASRKDIEASLREKPDNADFRYQQAFILRETGELEQSSRILRRLTQEQENNTEALHLFGTVEGELGRLGSSHLALARYFRMNREREVALWHYREATRLSSTGSVDFEQANSEMEALLAEERGAFFQIRRPPRR